MYKWLPENCMGVGLHEISHFLVKCMNKIAIGGGKDGAMGLQPHLILMVLYRNLIFIIESPT